MNIVRDETRFGYRILKIALLLAVAILITGIVDVKTIYADEDDSGICRGVPWRLTSEGEVLIGEEGREYTMLDPAMIDPETDGSETEFPWTWADYMDKIKSVKILGTVHVQGTAKELFSGCNMESADLTGLDTSQVTDMSLMFSFCEKIKELDLSGFDTRNVTNMDCMFRECHALETVDLSSFDTSQVTIMGCMFSGCQRLKTLDVSGFDTSQVTDMDEMFKECEKLRSLDVSGFDTSKVENFAYMFSNCALLDKIDVSGFDTSNGEMLCNMFESCASLKTVDVSGFDTSKAADMQSMFYGCRKLTGIDVSGFDTSNALYIDGMFQCCSSLRSIDVSGFDTRKARWLTGMFYGCSSLRKLDLSNFDTRNIKSMRNMFLGCSALTSLDISSFNTKKLSRDKAEPGDEDMFRGCIALNRIALGSGASFPTAAIPGKGWKRTKLLNGKSAKAPSVKVLVKDYSKKYPGWYSRTGKKFQMLKLQAKASPIDLSAAKVKKANSSIKSPVRVSGAKGRLTYKKASGKKAFTVNAKNGKITVKKGTRAGTYKVKVKVTAGQTSKYYKTVKTLTLTIRIQ